MAKRLEEQIHKLRIKNEIKFWYAKKQTIKRYTIYTYKTVKNGAIIGHNKPEYY
jgi:hypothetical protein